MENLVHSFFSTVSVYICTLSLTVVKHMDPLFVEVGLLGLQKVVCNSNCIIITAKKATSELLLHLEKDVVA